MQSIDIAKLHRHLVIVGPSGSGKDLVQQLLAEVGYSPCVTYTTRHPRKGETNGRSYWFVDKDALFELYAKHEILEITSYPGKCAGERGTVFYGSPANWHNDEYNSIILSPSGAKRVYGDPNVSVIWLDRCEHERKVLLRNRGDDENTIKARMNADRVDFAAFEKTGCWDVKLNMDILKESTWK